MSEQARRKLYVQDCKAVHSGTNRAGRDYTIYQIEAAREDRSPLPTNSDGSPMKLRSFESLPVGQIVEVSIEKFHSDQYGDSYTLKSVGGSKGAGNTQMFNELKEHIDELYNRVAKIWEKIRDIEGSHNAAPTSPSAAQPAPTPVGNVQPAASSGDGLPSDDDIPF